MRFAVRVSRKLSASASSHSPDIRSVYWTALVVVDLQKVHVFSARVHSKENVSHSDRLTGCSYGRRVLHHVMRRVQWIPGGMSLKRVI